MSDAYSLLVRYFNDEADSGMCDAVVNWALSSPENLLEFLQIASIWQFGQNALLEVDLPLALKNLTERINSEGNGDGTDL